jgi:CTP synthase (UTP-ammonia lyase)
MQRTSSPTPPAAVALVGDFDASVVAHRAIPLALQLAGEAAGVAVEPTWVHTAALGREGVESLGRFDGVWCVPASPYADMDAALAAIRMARESARPFLGTCGGFQHALIEYARNVLGIDDADHAETNPGAERMVIAPLTCSLVEKAGPLRLCAGSRLPDIYGSDAAEEVYHCRYGLNPRYAAQLFGNPSTGLCVAATDDAGEVRAVELAGHPFFVATLFQPERSALGGVAHPLVTAFVVAVGVRAAGLARGAPGVGGAGA